MNNPNKIVDNFVVKKRLTATNVEKYTKAKK